MARCAGVDHWKNGQPTDDNPRYGGAHYEDGKGWCNSQGTPITMKPWDGERISTVETHQRDNPNIPPGYTRVAMGVPCPIPGSEDGVCVYSVKGERAIWDDGDVYMVKK